MNAFQYILIITTSKDIDDGILYLLCPSKVLIMLSSWAICWTFLHIHPYMRVWTSREVNVLVSIFLGEFSFHPSVCVIWSATDVLMCTASIWHMCTMSMDRFFTLKCPMKYGRNKTRRMVAMKILFVWVVSIGICR